MNTHGKHSVFQGTGRSRDEEHTMTIQIQNVKRQTHALTGTARDKENDLEWSVEEKQTTRCLY